MRLFVVGIRCKLNTVEKRCERSFRKEKRFLFICILLIPLKSTTHVEDNDWSNHGPVEYYWIVHANTANRDPKYGQWSRFLLPGYTNLLTAKQKNESESPHCINYMEIALQALRGGIGSTALVEHRTKWRKEQHGWVNASVASPATSSINQSSSLLCHHRWSVINPQRQMI